MNHLSQKIVLIAGGTGFIGKALKEKFLQQGCEVRILTRKASDLNKGIYHWNPKQKTIDSTALQDVHILINLCGEGIADKRWSKERKKNLLDSRVETTKFLFSVFQNHSTLEHYISASGINAYGFENPAHFYAENDDYGHDFVSALVKKWEAAADIFSQKCKVSKLRIAVVLHPEHGALLKMAQPIRLGLGLPFGKGDQNIPWISLNDLTSLIIHISQHQTEGTFNAISGNHSNKEFTKTLSVALKRMYLPIGIPSLFLQLILGERACLILKGVKASNEKILKTSFNFLDTNLKALFKQFYPK